MKFTHQKQFIRVVALALFCIGGTPLFGADMGVTIDANDVAAMSANLSDEVFAFGPRIENREGWAKLAQRPVIHGQIAKAVELMAKPLPAVGDDLFLEFSRNGNRTDYEKAYFDRTQRVIPLVIAEGIEHHGRFVPAIEELVAAFDAQKTWMLPAHDAQLKNFHGEASDIDLFSSELACDLATANYILGDALDSRTREMIDSNVRRRVLDPFREMVTGKRKPDGWITVNNNWNAVCLANVLGAALATLPDKHDRAVFAAACEEDSTHYLSGFAADGYCVEGLGYWNYGFGNYMRLCELLYRATDGRVDCFGREKVRAIAEFPRKLEIADGVYPAYGDAHLDVKPWGPLVDFVDRRFGLAGEAEHRGSLSTSAAGNLSETLMFFGENSAAGKEAIAPEQPAAFDWFANVEVLTCRPEVKSRATLAVSIKGGCNGVSHGHDDLGSFVLVVGKTPLLVDPGTEIYTARTFGKDRYKSALINSFGHNVPLVAGGLQISTGKAAAKILDHDFGDGSDMLAMDLTSAYAAPELERLRRTFTYDRAGLGSLTVEDDCRFSSADAFGIQFITFGKWKQISPTEILVWEGDRAVRIDLDAGGNGLVFRSQLIEEDMPGKKRPTHISVDLAKPVKAVRVKAVMQPDEAPAGP